MATSIPSYKDYSTLLGIGLAFTMVGVAISISGNPASFVDLPSILIVVGGTWAVTLASFSWRDLLDAPLIAARNAFRDAADPREIGLDLLELADSARKKGLLGVQDEINDRDENEFLHKGMMMVIDGMEVDRIESVLRQDMYAAAERHSQSISVLRKMAEVSPAMGLIGTLIGLVQMLGELDNPSKIGPAMALALLTTFYGALLSYAFFSPLASKLERISAEETLVKTLTLRTVVSISRAENPRHLEILLNTILPPASRVQYFN